MSPLLKAISVGIAALVLSLLIMYLISRVMNRPFLPRFPQRVSPAPTPVQLIPPPR